MQLEYGAAIPLVGALFIAEGFVTAAQLETCLRLQSEQKPHMPIGQILLQQGYIGEADLDRIIALQQKLRASLLTVLDVRIAPERQDLDVPELSTFWEGELDDSLVFGAAPSWALPIR